MKTAADRLLIAAVFGVGLTACGGGGRAPARHASSGAGLAADGGPLDAVDIADLPPHDPCGGYAVAVKPFLGRVGQAADRFLDRMGTRWDAQRAAAADELAAALDAEVPALEALATGVQELDAAHVALIAAVREFARGARGIGEAARLEAKQGPSEQRHAALARLTAAYEGWERAVRALFGLCPVIGEAD